MPKRHRHRQASTPTPAAAPAPAPVPLAAETDPHDLAALLLSRSRVRPVVVVSRYAGDGPPRLDRDAIAEELKGIADVIVVVNGPQTYQLQDLLPPDTNVFGSAARIYPVGLEWTKHPFQSRLWLIRTDADIEHVTAQVIRDTEELAFGSTWETTTAAPAATLRDSGLIRSIAPDGSRAVIELPNGVQAFLPAEASEFDVPLNWWLAEGLTVPGSLDTEKRIFRIEGLQLPISGDGYPDGSVVPALVRATSTGSAELSLVPGHSHTLALSSISSNELDSAADLLTVGEVVAVRLRRTGSLISLSMLDVDDAEPVLVAPELLPGGAPWLVPGRDLVDETEPTTTSEGIPPASSPAPAEATAAGTRALKSVELALATERAKNQRLAAELEALKAANEQFQAHAAELDADAMLGRQQAAELSGAQQEVRRLHSDLASTRGQLVDLRKKFRSARRDEAAPDFVFLDPRKQFAFYLDHAWALQIPAADKDRLALGPYRVGEDFLRSMREQPQDKQKKAFKAIVDLLVNDTARLSAREAHQLRTNASGGSAPKTRNNGQDTCWRLSIEQNVAAARRLHYWKCGDGVIELASVTVHDVTSP